MEAGKTREIGSVQMDLFTRGAEHFQEIHDQQGVLLKLNTKIINSRKSLIHKVLFYLYYALRM